MLAISSFHVQQLYLRLVPTRLGQHRIKSEVEISSDQLLVSYGRGSAGATMLTWPLFLLAAATTPAADGREFDEGASFLRLAMPIFDTNETPHFWQVVIEQQIIIRVPARRSSINNFASPSQVPVRPS